MGKVVDSIKQAKVGAGGVVPYLKGKGVKNEEIKWSGIEAFLEGKKSDDGTLISYDLVSQKKRSVVLQSIYLSSVDYQKRSLPKLC